MRIILLSCSVMLLAGLAGRSRADDYESPAVRDAVDRQLAPFGLPGWNAIPPARAGELIIPSHARDRKLLAQTERLLDKIIIPSFAIRDVPLAQALAKLQTEIVRGDTADAAATGGESGKMRVNLRVDVAGKEPGYNPTVTLQLQDATPRQVLTGLAYPLGLAVTVSGDSVWLVTPPKGARQ